MNAADSVIVYVIYYERKCIIEYGVIMSVPENKKKKRGGEDGSRLSFHPIIP